MTIENALSGLSYITFSTVMFSAIISVTILSIYLIIYVTLNLFIKMRLNIDKILKKGGLIVGGKV